jgi:hypothetical protein
MSQPISGSWQSFGRRVLGALRLDSATYRELAHSPSALPQAIAVILLGSLASAMVYLIDGESPGLGVNVNWGSYPVTRESDVAAALAGAVLDGGWGLLIWAAQAAIIWLLWNRFSSRTRTWRAIAAPLGFANAPLIVFGLLELVPVAGPVLGALGLLYTIVTSLVAVRASLAIGWGRALVLLVVSVVVLLPLPIALTWLT